MKVETVHESLGPLKSLTISIFSVLLQSYICAANMDVQRHDKVEDVQRHDKVEDVQRHDKVEDVQRHDKVEDVQRHDKVEDVQRHDKVEDVQRHDKVEDVQRHDKVDVICIYYLPILWRHFPSMNASKAIICNIIVYGIYSLNMHLRDLNGVKIHYWSFHLNT